MSLDLYITSSRMRTASGTGVYVRSNGKTVELKTIDEIRDRFPERDLDNITVREYETDEMWHGNITHNLGEMADHVPCGDSETLYDALWLTEDRVPDDGYVAALSASLAYMAVNRRDLEQYNPANGWGSWKSLYKFLADFIDGLTECMADGEEITVHASR